MAKKDETFMRIDKDLLKELQKIKLAKRESYAEVVKRLIDKERKLK
jgi:predicted CopG family antitoxin